MVYLHTLQVALIGSKVKGCVISGITYVDLCSQSKKLSYKLIIAPKGSNMQQTEGPLKA